MSGNTYESSNDANDGSTLGLFLVAVMLVGVGLGVMVWEDRQDNYSSKASMLTHQTGQFLL